MSFQKPITIKEAVLDNIKSEKYLLPSIQREFVWDLQKIEKLFDSLMRGYPINSFLFLKIPKEKVSEFKFYEFIKDYHQMNNYHNKEANTNGCDDIIAVLDGQQRLTSLYIALKGSYTSKISCKRWNNKNAYTTKKLYINALNLLDDIYFRYQFKFLKEDEAKIIDENNFWFEVGKILNFNKKSDIDLYIKNIKSDQLGDNKLELIREMLYQLYYVINEQKIINYYLEESTELDKVLDIFIRINSGGTTLSYSDLLLSFATAQWENKDARKEITEFVDDMNNIGDGFNINKDFVLRACLVICDFSDISFKVDNFNRTNMLKIEKDWEIIKKSIEYALKLISSLGFNRDNLSSNYAIIPIAYYLKHIGLPNNFEISTSNVENIKLWFISSLLKRVFSFSPEGVLKPIREIIKSNTSNKFPVYEIVDRFKGTNRSIQFTQEDINNLIYTKYGQNDVLSILSILYPWADLKNKFHIDHIFPKSKFTRKKLLDRGFSESKINFFMENYNFIGNLQLLEGIKNLEKKDKDFKDWIAEFNFNDVELKNYEEKHYIPHIDLEFENFDNFLNERNKLIIDGLSKNLITI